MRKEQQKKKGFVLTDVLLYVAITALLLLSMVSFTAVMLEGRVKNSVVAEVEQQGVQVLRIFREEVRGAKQIISPGRGQSGDSLVLEKEEGVVSFSFDEEKNSLVMSKGGSNIYLTGGQVGITEVEFNNLSKNNTPGVVQVQISIFYRTDSPREIYNYSNNFITSATLR